MSKQSSVKHIVIDARFWGPKGTGLGRYISSLVMAIAKFASSKERYTILVGSQEVADTVTLPSQFTVHVADIPWYSFREQYSLFFLLRSLRPDLVHFGHFNVPVLWALFGGRFIITVHDMIKHRYYDRSATTRGWFVYFIKRFVYLFVVRTAVWRAFSVIAPSQATRKDILSYYSFAAPKTVVILEAHTDCFSKITSINPDVVFKKYGITPPFLFYVGNAYPYKNTILLLETLKRLPAHYTLVHPCARDHFYDTMKDEVSRRSLEDRVVFPGFVTDEELAVLYASCAVYVFPSFMEGFGLPVLEAMSCGAPVACSSASSLPEVAGEAALYFDPSSVDECVFAVSRFFDDPGLRADYIEKGFQQLTHFSWDRAAKETVHEYRRSLSS